MKQGMKIIGGVLLAAALSSPAWAKHGNPGGPPESMAGGLPALEDRVDALDLQNNWAQVSSACAVVNSSSSAGPVTAAPVATGECAVTFSKDVSGCSAVATIVGAFGEITVASATKTITGDTIDVFTDVPAATPANEAFNLTVTCP